MSRLPFDAACTNSSAINYIAQNKYIEGYKKVVKHGNAIENCEYLLY